MKLLNKFLLVLLATASLAACDVNEGPVEEAGESVDQAIENTEDATEDAVDEVDDTID